MLDNEFAQVVPLDEQPPDGRTLYIPHHGVIQSELPVVFDCSATCHRVSLNDRLLHDPALSNSLLGILLRFSLGEVGVTCDIQKIYHLLSVSPDDRGLLCFHWWPQSDLKSEPVDYRMKVHFLVQGLPLQLQLMLCRKLQLIMLRSNYPTHPCL